MYSNYGIRASSLCKALIQPVLWLAKFSCCQVRPHFSVIILLLIEGHSQCMFTGPFPGVSEMHVKIYHIMKCKFKIITINQEAILNNLGRESVRIVIFINSCMNRKNRLPQKATK